jgi:hypothetical protein
VIKAPVTSGAFVFGLHNTLVCSYGRKSTEEKQEKSDVGHRGFRWTNVFLPTILVGSISARCSKYCALAAVVVAAPNGKGYY